MLNDVQTERMANNRTLLTTQEVAQRLKVDRQTILRWARTGRLIPAHQLGEARNSAYLFELDAVRDLEEARSA